MKARIMYLIHDTVHSETVEGHRISITTEPDGRAVVVVYDDQDLRTQVYMYRTFERCVVLYDTGEVDLLQNDHSAGQDPEIRKTVSLAAHRP